MKYSKLSANKVVDFPHHGHGHGHGQTRPNRKNGWNKKRARNCTQITLCTNSQNDHGGKELKGPKKEYEKFQFQEHYYFH